MLRIVALGLCLVGMTGPAWADYKCAGEMPPASARQEPTVGYSTLIVPPARFHRICTMHTDYSCARSLPNGRWLIAINANLSSEEIACSVIYEKAHLAPNYWGDPKVETPQTIKWLTEQKRVSR